MVETLWLVGNVTKAVYFRYNATALCERMYDSDGQTWTLKLPSDVLTLQSKYMCKIICILFSCKM